MKYSALLVTLLFPATSWAEEALKSPPDLAVGSMIASLLLVLACIFIFAFLMKKSNLIRNPKGYHQIKIVATQPLTNKGRVQIIEVNEKRYLLGVTEQNINLLDTFSIPENEESEMQQQDANTPFATLLSKISTKRNE
ncbi:flagellar biosynthetic protein FliO [Psychromonas sp. psych-6C06]|uniref:flagellar biosynthetic protein FliO n=1 Tax=Psychromonas sp. psych-6C06 TaxID=2058089 RepID=UPI000C33317A|nr:flagellar biosynthetic protein FliO [Psychromonas sp. psych-6C06]PKF62938.1 flagellar biosynthetic protein FliO [Psychromonas sp. psych-6C06]